MSGKKRRKAIGSSAREQRQYLRDAQFLRSLQDDPRYNGKCVAVYRGKVIAVGTDLKAMVAEIAARRHGLRVLRRAPIGYLGDPKISLETRRRLRQKGYWV